VKALITGGAGFIGSHLAERLLRDGHEVAVLDNLSTGSIDNISHLKNTPGFSYAIDSVTNESLLAEMIDRSDVVFHLAAAVGVKLIVEQPVHTIETNVHGTEVVLKHANKKKKLVFIASTSEVYGKSTDVPFREGAELVLGATVKHRWAYACSKLIDEFLALAYWKERKLPVVIGGVFNVGNTDEVSIRELAERVKTLSGSQSTIQYVPYDEAYEAGFEDMPRRVPDISKIRELVDYQPQLELNDIIKTVIEHIRQK
jgi:nucleoside-diphosphate-sugar epimerase